MGAESESTGVDVIAYDEAAAGTVAATLWQRMQKTCELVD
jgi:hypothetical protein